MKSILMITSAIAGVCFMATLGAAADIKSAKAAPAAATQAKVLAVCQGCHGPGGNSVLPIYPRLNGQQADYIAIQLKNLHDHKRDDTRARGYMWPIARDLDSATVREVAAYFAAQKPTEPQTGGDLAAEGEAIYRNGIAAEGVLACRQCHGSHGEGQGATPRIAGQHAAYFRMVMGAFRSTLRRHDMMNPVAKNLTDRQVEALASYLAND